MEQIIGTFGAVNWLVLVLFLAGTTLVGHLTRGKTTSMHGFFLGGRNIPWWAVSASIVATQTSTLTFIAVPAVVFKAGGNLTFHQMTYGILIGNVLMALVFVKSYYESEYYSPYDFIGARLDERISHLARALFVVGAILMQSVRLLSTALILSVVTGLPVGICIGIIGVFAVVWTLMGGITTVIWTDVVQFFVFVSGGLFAVAWMLHLIPGGIADILAIADRHAKLALFNLSTDPRASYTLWVGIVGFSVLQFSMDAVDQVSTQRILCCKNARDAQKAVVFSSLGGISFVMMLTVGLLLAVFYDVFPLPVETAARIAGEPDRIFPYFIVHNLPVGISGMIIAALFAAGISTLDSALAALTQTVVTGFYRPFVHPGGSERHYLAASKIGVVLFSVVLSGLAFMFHLLPNEGLLNLGLMVPGYVFGALLGISILALFRKGTFPVVLIAAACSVMLVLVLQRAGVYSLWWYPAGAVTVVGIVLVVEWSRGSR